MKQVKEFPAAIDAQPPVCATALGATTGSGVRTRVIVDTLFPKAPVELDPVCAVGQGRGRGRARGALMACFGLATFPASHAGNLCAARTPAVGDVCGLGDGAGVGLSGRDCRPTRGDVYRHNDSFWNGLRGRGGVVAQLATSSRTCTIHEGNRCGRRFSLEHVPWQWKGTAGPHARPLTLQVCLCWYWRGRG